MKIKKEIEHCPSRLHTGTGAPERAIQTLNNLNFAKSEDKIGFTENINRDLRVMGFTIHTGLKLSPFERHHGRKLRTKLTNIVNDNNSYLSCCTTVSISVPPKQIPFYVARNEKGKVTDYIVMDKKKLPCCLSHRSPEGNFPITIDTFRQEKLEKSLKRKYKEQRKIVNDGTKHTVGTADIKILHQMLMSNPLKFR